MIYDNLKNTGSYTFTEPGIAQVLEAAKAYTPENFPNARVVLDGDNVFMNMPAYETHDAEKAVLEAHVKYVDVMVMIEGRETIYVKNTDRLQDVYSPYEDGRDALLAHMDADVIPVDMQPGDFLVLLPQDAHAPGCHAGQPAKVKKIIGKVRITHGK